MFCFHCYADYLLRVSADTFSIFFHPVLCPRVLNPGGINDSLAHRFRLQPMRQSQEIRESRESHVKIFILSYFMGHHLWFFVVCWHTTFSINFLLQDLIIATSPGLFQPRSSNITLTVSCTDIEYHPLIFLKHALRVILLNSPSWPSWTYMCVLPGPWLM